MIPNQLKDQLFCRIKKYGKKPIGNGWQHNGYTAEQVENHIPAENYGVLAGINQLGILDDDTPKKELLQLYDQHFKPTFRVRDHYYIFLDGWDCKKIVLNHPTNLYPDKKGKLSHHMGELQGLGSQAVGPGSTHENGELYEIKQDLPITRIEYSEFMKVFGEFAKPKKPVQREFKRTNWQGEKVQDLPLTNIVSIPTGKYQGSHPVHGSTTGHNFSTDTDDNTWYCFRCCSGGGPAELIAVMEGIIDCFQAGKSCLTQQQAIDVIMVAREKYGLKTPDNLNLEPKGWANSVSIVKLAQKYGIKRCPKCNTLLNFNDRLGWFKCNKCSIKGGLHSFASLIIDKSQAEA